MYSKMSPTPSMLSVIVTLTPLISNLSISEINRLPLVLMRTYLVAEVSEDNEFWYNLLTDGSPPVTSNTSI